MLLFDVHILHIPCQTIAHILHVTHNIIFSIDLDFICPLQLHFSHPFSSSCQPCYSAVFESLVVESPVLK